MRIEHYYGYWCLSPFLKKYYWLDKKIDFVKIDSNYILLTIIIWAVLFFRGTNATTAFESEHNLLRNLHVFDADRYDRLGQMRVQHSSTMLVCHICVHARKLERIQCVSSVQWHSIIPISFSRSFYRNIIAVRSSSLCFNAPGEFDSTHSHYSHCTGQYQMAQNSHAHKETKCLVADHKCYTNRTSFHTLKI